MEASTDSDRLIAGNPISSFGNQVKTRDNLDPGNPSRFGFTIVEVLVVITIIGLLISLLLPAIQAAKESSRQTACANNLRQLALAAHQHETAHKIFPTGGWGANWVGDPDAGFGIKQPGGWIYNILPYIEETKLRNLGKGAAGPEKRIALAGLLQIPIALFSCPTKRPPLTYPYKGPTSLQNVDPPGAVAKSDYVINGQISFLKSEVFAPEIERKRGLGKTVLVGEKTVAPSHYTDGQGQGDMLTMYIGDCDDIRRAVTGSPISDAEGVGVGFGGPHSSGCNIAMCDASVRFVASSESLQP